MTRDDLARREEPIDFGLCPRCDGEMDGPYRVCASCEVKDAVRGYHAELKRVRERSVNEIDGMYREILDGEVAS